MDKFVITEEEKKRILTMHILRSKNQYLNEDISSKVKLPKRYSLKLTTGYDSFFGGGDVIAQDLSFEECQYQNICKAKGTGFFDDHETQQIFFDCNPTNKSKEEEGRGRWSEPAKVVSNLHLVKWEEGGSRLFKPEIKGIYTPVENAELVNELKAKFCK